MPASPRGRGCYSRCSSEQHKSSDSGLSSPRPGHSTAWCFCPCATAPGTHSCSFPSSERTMHVAITTWPPIKRVLRLSAAPNLAWRDRHGPPRWGSPGRRGTLGLSPHSFSVLSFIWHREDRQQQRQRQCQRAVVVLLGFSSSVSNAARVAADAAGQQHALPQLSSRALGAVSLQRVSQRSLQAAVAWRQSCLAYRFSLRIAWLRSDGGTTHSKSTLLESASQPACAIRIQIILALVPSGTHRTIWEGGLFTPERFARPVPQPALQPRGTVRSVCRQDPAPLP